MLNAAPHTTENYRSGAARQGGRAYQNPPVREFRAHAPGVIDYGATFAHGLSR